MFIVFGADGGIHFVWMGGVHTVLVGAGVFRFKHRA